MAAVKVSTIIKNVTRRAWLDFEPKVLAFLATGVTATGLISAADHYAGIHLSADQASLAVVLISAVAGYIKKSTSKIEVPAQPAPVDESSSASM